ncbi:hypothetical protein [Shinella sp.]|uniref:hypothetical protein n=1 Tax=Shinella sp. TaxID=1870904 RepID=UPI003F727376
MKPNIEKYRRYVDALNLSEDQKVELIESVWRLVEGFADRAFGHDSYSFLASSEPKIAGVDRKLIDLKPQKLASAFGAADHGETGKP